MIRYEKGETVATTSKDDTAHAAAADVEKFAAAHGPFVLAAKKTRMPMIFTDAKDQANPIIFANKAFHTLTGFDEAEVLGTDFYALMARGVGSASVTEIKAAFAGTADSEPEISFKRDDGTTFCASLFISPVAGDDGTILQHFISLVDRTSDREKQAHCEMMIDELNHRVKNTLSTVQSIARQALRGATDPAVIRESIESRIFALSRSHDLLSHQNWEGASLRDVVGAALEPFHAADGLGERFRIAGANVRMPPKATLALGIAFHELATNAVKYGALSNDAGTVAVDWSIDGATGGDRLRIGWRESGGPPVAPPDRKGFGSQVLERGLAHELGGTVRLDYRSAGIACFMDLPLQGKVAVE